MAVPTFVTAGTGVGSAGSGTSPGALNITVPYPASGIVAGDRIILQIEAENFFGGATVNTPSGFNLLFNDGGTFSGGDSQQYIFERQATGSENGSTISVTGTWTVGTAANTGIFARTYVWRGVRLGSSFTTTGGSNNGASTAAAPAALTTTVADSLALLFNAIANDSTVADVSGESGGSWTAVVATFTSVAGPDGALNCQSASMAAPGTISGGTSAVNPTATWITRTFALLPLESDAPFGEDGSNDEIISVWAETSFDQNYTTDVSSVSAVRPDLPEDFILGIEFADFADPPNDQDWNDWSWAQAPPIDDLPEDFLLGIDDGTTLDDPAYTDWFKYGTQTDPLSADIIDFAQLPFVEDGNAFGDPSFTDDADYSTYTDPLSDDAEPPIDVVKDASNDFDDPALTDWFEYGTQSDPLSEDKGEEPVPASIDDGTNLGDYSDLDDYSTYTDILPDDVEEQPLPFIEDSTNVFEEPSLTDLTDYSSYTAPLSPDAPPSPLANGGDDSSTQIDTLFPDLEDYGSITPPPIPPAPPIPPVIPTATPCLRLYENGPPAITACNLNTFEQTCNTIAELRELIGTPGLQVCVRGAYAVADGSAGAFIWSASQIGGDDGLTIIFPTGGANTGAWVRISWLSNGNQFLPLAGAPAANPNGGYIYVLSDGTLRYRGPTSDSTLAPA